MEYKKDEWVEVGRNEKTVQYAYFPSNYPGPIAMDAIPYQPERLNPKTSKEDAIVRTSDESGRERSEAVAPPCKAGLHGQ